MRRLLALVLLSGCAMSRGITEDILIRQASFEQNCPPAQVRVDEWSSDSLGNNAYTRVNACGHERQYEWVRALGKWQDVTPSR